MNFEKSYYEKTDVWQNYFNNKEENLRVKITHDIMPKEINSVLDIGCGVGILTNTIKKTLVVGIDFARTPLKHVKNNAIQASITNIPIKSEKFDLIIITEVLEHLDDQNFSKGIQEILRMNSNYIMVSTPFNEDVTLGLCKCKTCGNLFSPVYHQRSFSTELLASLFTGYTIEKTVYSTYRITPNTKLLKFKQRLGIYGYSKVAVCNKCGDSSIKPYTSVYLFFGLINQSLYFIKRVFGIKKPYHQILLLKKIKNES